MAIEQLATQPSELDKKTDDVNQITEVPSATHEEEAPAPVIKVDSYLDDEHINLSWRSWLVVFVTCFA